MTRQDLQECQTKRQLLEHEKTRQFISIWNKKRERKWSKEDGDFHEFTLPEIIASRRLTNTLVNCAIGDDSGIRANLNLAKPTQSRIRQVQATLRRIQSGEVYEGLLDSYFSQSS